MSDQPDAFVDAQDEENSQFVSVLVEETPRGAILVSAQFADTMLTRMLTAACRSTQIASKLLDGFNAPLGTFSTRILAAYALGLLPEDEYRNLEQLRKVRNYCAHNMGAVGFDDPEVKPHLANLRIDPSLEDDPITKLGAALGGLQAWCQLVTSKLEKRSHDRLPALDAERHAAEQDSANHHE